MSLHLGGLWILVEVNWLLFVQNNWLQTHHDCSERSKRKGSSFSSWTLKIHFLKPCSNSCVCLPVYLNWYFLKISTSHMWSILPKYLIKKSWMGKYIEIIIHFDNVAKNLAKFVVLSLHIIFVKIKTVFPYF